jgi:hypothetical protein
MGFSEKLGASYIQAKDQVKIKTIKVELDNTSFELKVKIPLKQEMEDLMNTISSPPKELIDEAFEKFAKPIKESIKEGGDKFIENINSEKEMIVVKDDDFIIDGNSIKQVANLTAMWQIKVEGYFHLLQSETGEPIIENFAQISAEFPESIIKKIIEEIDKAIKPTYEDVKKN